MPSSELVQTPWFDFEPTHIPLAFGSANLGDHIQTEAACRLWNCRNFVDREFPTTWSSDAVVPLIGWWLHGKEEFIPPCQSVIVGFHVQSDYKKYVTPKVIDYWKLMVYEQGFPAMCRDLSTRNYLRSLGIDAEFGGCVTLTLPKYGGARSGKYSVDCKTSKAGYTKHTHMIGGLLKKTNEEKLQMASDYMELYEKAEIVETSRLHCWLPCKSFGTNVTFLEEEVYYQRNRLSGYLD